MLLGGLMSEETIEEEIIEEEIEEDIVEALKLMVDNYSKVLDPDEQREYNEEIMVMIKSLVVALTELYSVYDTLKTVESLRVMTEMVKSFSEAAEKGKQVNAEAVNEVENSTIYS